jgi:hypothetical protein
MARKRKNPSRRELLESQLSELAALVKDLAPQAQVVMSLAQYEDENAHVSIYPPPTMGVEEVRRLELALGERCNAMLVETGLFIIGAVCD